MLPYGLSKVRAPISVEPSKAKVRQSARREIGAELWAVAHDTYYFDHEIALISHCATCDFLPCCCICARAA